MNLLRPIAVREDVHIAALQGLADYAVAAAGGKVTGHSLLAALPGQEDIQLWRRAASVLTPTTSPYTHPNADKVCTYKQRTP